MHLEGHSRWVGERGSRLRGWAVALVLSAVMVVGAVAEASNYYLEDIGRFEDAQVKLFKDNNIETTEQFLAAVLTLRQRKALAGKVNMTEAVLLEFAKDCELMQITGVGPRAARLLRASGIVSASDLAGRKPDELLHLIKLANSEQKLTQKDPTVSIVEYWIAQAAKVPYHLR